MSASLFADMYYGNPPAPNYIEYNEGDKKFGELQRGDEIYLYHYSNDEILNITVIGKLIVGRKNIHIKTKSFRLNPSSKTKIVSNDIVFGPVDGNRYGKEGNYTPSNVEKSSICISFGGEWAVGTNRETVLKYAKSDISNSIQKTQSDIQNLQKEVESLNKKLENIV